MVAGPSIVFGDRTTAPHVLDHSLRTDREESRRAIPARIAPGSLAVSFRQQHNDTMHPRHERAGKRASQGWDIDQLNRLLGSARTMPGEIAGIPAGKWWPALLLTIIDTRAPVTPILEARASDYSHTHGALTLGLLVYELQPVTIAVIDEMRRHSQPRLFPWPWDRGRFPWYMLYRRLKELLYRADLPPVRENLTPRLQATDPALLRDVNLSLPFTPRAGEYRHPRARDLRPKSDQPQRVYPGSVSADARPLTCITIDCDRTLRRFLKDVYIPLRLRSGSPETHAKYRTAVRRLRDFLGVDPTLEMLSEDRLSEWAHWQQAAGLAPETCNSRIAHLLALWRFAWKRRLVDVLPRGRLAPPD